MYLAWHLMQFCLLLKFAQLATTHDWFSGLYPAWHVEQPNSLAAMHRFDWQTDPLSEKPDEHTAQAS